MRTEKIKLKLRNKIEEIFLSCVINILLFAFRCCFLFMFTTLFNETQTLIRLAKLTRPKHLIKGRQTCQSQIKIKIELNLFPVSNHFWWSIFQDLLLTKKMFFQCGNWNLFKVLIYITVLHNRIDINATQVSLNMLNSKLNNNEIAFRRKEVQIKLRNMNLEPWIILAFKVSCHFFECKSSFCLIYREN